MVDLRLEDWASLYTVHDGKPRKLGRKTAEKVVRALHGHP